MIMNIIYIIFRLFLSIDIFYYLLINDKSDKNEYKQFVYNQKQKYINYIINLICAILKEKYHISENELKHYKYLQDIKIYNLVQLYFINPYIDTKYYFIQYYYNVYDPLYYIKDKK